MLVSFFSMLILNKKLADSTQLNFKSITHYDQVKCIPKMQKWFNIKKLKITNQ